MTETEETSNILTSNLVGLRGPRSPADFKAIVEHMAGCAQRIGQMFGSPKCPEKVPAQAPESNEWIGISRLIKGLSKQYKECYDAYGSRSKKKAASGGLTQYVYITREMAEVINDSEILGELKVDFDESGKFGYFKRALLTSFFTAYIDAKNLKHPDEPTFNILDETLKTMFGDKMAEIKASKNKKDKVKELEVTNPETGKVEKVACFSYDSVPMINNYFIVGKLTPIITDPDIIENIDNIRNVLVGLTKVRGEKAKAVKLEKKATEKKSTKPNVRVTRTVVLNVHSKSKGQ